MCAVDSKLIAYLLELAKARTSAAGPIYLTGSSLALHWIPRRRKKNVHLCNTFELRCMIALSLAA